MKILSLVPLLVISLFAHSAFSQDDAKERRRSRSRFTWGVSTMMWQENIDAKLNGEKMTARGQAASFGVEVGYERFMNRRNQYFWAAKVGAMTGTMWASGSSEKFKASSFIGGYLEPGIFRRQTSKAEFGFIFPVTYRIVNWESYNQNLSADDSQTSMAYGMGARINLAFESGNFLTTGLVYRLSEPSAMWVIGYNFR